MATRMHLSRRVIHSVHVPKAKRDLLQQSIYLERDKAVLLDQLAQTTLIPKAVLLRKAVDALLEVNGLLSKPRQRPMKRPTTVQ
jgi:Ribbon-helix-helix domain